MAASISSVNGSTANNTNNSSTAISFSSSSNTSTTSSTSTQKPDMDTMWYFTSDQLANSPSRRHGIDPEQELSFRQLTAYLIQDMGQRLQVSQLCINTAIVYMHRFYAFHSFNHFHRNGIAAASLFLAAKVEEQPRKLEHVIRAAHMCVNQDLEQTLPTSEQYNEQAQDLVFNENVLLQTLGFDVAIDHPHTHVVKTCHLVKACKDLAQTSYFLASNSLHLTSMCLQYKPTVVACFCIYLACKWSRWEIPQSTEGKHWFHYVDKTVTMDLLKQLTDEFIAIYEKSPARLKSKLNSIKALAQGKRISEQPPTGNSNGLQLEQAMLQHQQSTRRTLEHNPSASSSHHQSSSSASSSSSRSHPHHHHHSSNKPIAPPNDVTDHKHKQYQNISRSRNMPVNPSASTLQFAQPTSSKQPIMQPPPIQQRSNGSSSAIRPVPSPQIPAGIQPPQQRPLPTQDPNYHKNRSLPTNLPPPNSHKIMQKPIVGPSSTSSSTMPKDLSSSGRSSSSRNIVPTTNGLDMTKSSVQENQWPFMPQNMAPNNPPPAAHSLNRNKYDLHSVQQHQKKINSIDTSMELCSPPKYTSQPSSQQQNQPAKNASSSSIFSPEWNQSQKQIPQEQSFKRTLSDSTKTDEDLLQRDIKMRKVENNFAAPLNSAGGIETNPDLVSCLLKESLGGVAGGGYINSEILDVDNVKPILSDLNTNLPNTQQTLKSADQPMQVVENTTSTTSGAGIVHNESDEITMKIKSEKKKKKDKHKHKEKDKTKDKDHDKKKHKKDKNHHQQPQQQPQQQQKERLSGTESDPVKLKISKDKLNLENGNNSMVGGGGPISAGDSSGFKIKIPKDRLNGYHPQQHHQQMMEQQLQQQQNIDSASGPALKIKISKEKIESYSNNSNTNLQSNHHHHHSHSLDANNSAGFGMIISNNSSSTNSGSSSSSSSSKKKDRDRDREHKEKKRSSGDFNKQQNNGSGSQTATGSSNGGSSKNQSNKTWDF